MSRTIVEALAPRALVAPFLAACVLLAGVPEATAAPQGQKARAAAAPRSKARPRPRAAAPAATAPRPTPSASTPPAVQAAPAQKKPAVVAGAQAQAPAEVLKTEEARAGEKTYTFGAQEVEGRLKSPQILYFLRRVRAQFDPAPLGHRSFLLELSDTRRHPALE